LLTCTANATSNEILIKNGFPTSASIKGLTLQFSFNGLKLPRYSGLLEDLLYLSTLDSSYNVVDVGNTTITISITESMNSCSLTTLSQINDDITSLSVTFNASISLLIDDIVILGVPNSLSNNILNVTCLNSSLVCNIENSTNITIKTDNITNWNNT
jgi:hypothetical protein